MKHAYHGEMLRTGSAKFLIDGVIEGYTGLLGDPYADDPSTCGAANYEIGHYNQMVAEADRLGLQVITHSVGDMGVRRVLDAYQNAQQLNGKRDSRHRVEHIELIHPQDLPRFQKLGVIASMQPLHSPMQVDENDIWPVRVGRGRWPLSFAWQDDTGCGGNSCLWVRLAGRHTGCITRRFECCQSPALGGRNATPAPDADGYTAFVHPGRRLR